MKIEPDILEQCRLFRRAVHRHPELANAEFKTQDAIRRELEALGFELRPFSSSSGSTGVVAVWPGKDRSASVAIRADMDALPLQETSGLPWASMVADTMHACGHDGHSSILLGLAMCLHRRSLRFPCDIKLLFQPAEEAGNGARQMIEDGALEDPPVRAVFALHGWPSLPEGKAGLHPGPMMGSVDNFEIRVQGQGGHGAQPHLALDPVVAAAQLVTLSQALISRGLDPLEPAVLTFGQIQGGHTFNVIPESCLLRGTVRTLSASVRRKLKLGLETLSLQVCQGMGLVSNLQWVESCPATINNTGMAELVRRAIKQELGEENFQDESPSMAGEDFSFFLEKVPGAYFWLGLGNGRGSLHNPGFDFNDACIETGIRTFLSILREFFQENP